MAFQQVSLSHAITCTVRCSLQSSSRVSALQAFHVVKGFDIKSVKEPGLPLEDYTVIRLDPDSTLSDSLSNKHMQQIFTDQLRSYYAQ